MSGNHVRKRNAPTVLFEESRGRPAGAQNNVIKARKKNSQEVWNIVQKSQKKHVILTQEKSENNIKMRQNL